MREQRDKSVICVVENPKDLIAMEKTKEFKDLFSNQLVFVFIKVVENQKNIDIDNKFIKPIVDGLVLSKVIADDNIANVFYGVLGQTDKKKNPYTEVYVFKGDEMLKWIQNTIQTDISKTSDQGLFLETLNGYFDNTKTM